MGKLKATWRFILPKVWSPFSGCQVSFFLWFLIFVLLLICCFFIILILMKVFSFASNTLCSFSEILLDIKWIFYFYFFATYSSRSAHEQRWGILSFRRIFSVALLESLYELWLGRFYVVEFSESNCGVFMSFFIRRDFSSARAWRWKINKPNLYVI